MGLDSGMETLADLDRYGPPSWQGRPRRFQASWRPMPQDGLPGFFQIGS
jgi:hypothetical protein